MASPFANLIQDFARTAIPVAVAIGESLTQGPGNRPPLGRGAAAAAAAGGVPPPPPEPGRDRDPSADDASTSSSSTGVFGRKSRNLFESLAQNLFPGKAVDTILGLRGLTRGLAFSARTLSSVLTWRRPHAVRYAPHERNLSHPPRAALLCMVVWTLACFQTRFLLFAAPLWLACLLPIANGEEEEEGTEKETTEYPDEAPRGRSAAPRPHIPSYTAAAADTHAVQPPPLPPRMSADGAAPPALPPRPSPPPLARGDDDASPSRTEQLRAGAQRLEDKFKSGLSHLREHAPQRPDWLSHESAAAFESPDVAAASYADSLPVHHAEQRKREVPGAVGQVIDDLVEVRAVLVDLAGRVRRFLDILDLDASIRRWAAAAARPVPATSKPAPKQVTVNTLGIRPLRLDWVVLAMAWWASLAAAGATVPVVWANGCLAMAVLSEPGLFYAARIVPWVKDDVVRRTYHHLRRLAAESAAWITAPPLAPLPATGSRASEIRAKLAVLPREIAFATVALTGGIFVRLVVPPAVLIVNFLREVQRIAQAHEMPHGFRGSSNVYFLLDLNEDDAGLGAFAEFASDNDDEDGEEEEEARPGVIRELPAEVALGKVPFAPAPRPAVDAVVEDALALARGAEDEAAAASSSSSSSSSDSSSSDDDEEVSEAEHHAAAMSFLAEQAEAEATSLPPSPVVQRALPLHPAALSSSFSGSD
ncbi:hypothetical protein H9P43_003382 [Blastocladiella emersonii ATCC 22665]|nr:hypothetical protein H9P43_003382 [Blastocladiella emersonii ATCC 22665]